MCGGVKKSPCVLKRGKQSRVEGEDRGVVVEADAKAGRETMIANGGDAKCV